MKSPSSLIVPALASALVFVLGQPATPIEAASHREAPLIAMDPYADISDFFMFRSYEPGREDRVALVMNVVPGAEPSSGPNYFGFDPNVRYAMHVDNNMDGVAHDISFEFEFTSEFRGINRDAGLFLSYVALPPITALDGPGSEGLGTRQHMRVYMVKNGKRTLLADRLVVVPPNVGPRTTPNYDALAAQGVYDIGAGARVFAGPRQDPFYIDLGGVFDTLNLRRDLPLLSTAEDADDETNSFGVDMLSGFNVQTIALEVPIRLLTRDALGQADTAFPKLGAYASTSRRKITTLRSAFGAATNAQPLARGPWVQVQRLANPLVNEAIIGTVDKDRWNASDPSAEAAFTDYYLNPRLALALELVYGVPAAKSGRTDLRDLLLRYAPGAGRLSELLRLDVSVPPTPLAVQRRLGPLAHDAAGASTPDPAAWPNGRRPGDDVTDVAVRVIGGPNYVAGMAGDGVNVDDAALTASFPFLSSPANGRDRVHANP